jgi:hypothetical protein
LNSGAQRRPVSEVPSVAYLTLRLEPAQSAPLLPDEPLTFEQPVVPRISVVPFVPIQNAPVSASQTQTPSTQAPTTPRIDWQAEAAKVAQNQMQPAASSTFSPEPKTARKPCEIEPGSFVWNPELKHVGPIYFSKKCIHFIDFGPCAVDLGIFGCAQRDKDPGNGHLFDDVLAGKTPESSVPDANLCD